MVVQPADKRGVDGHPLGVAHRSTCTNVVVDVIMEIVFAEYHGEVGFPGIVGGGGLIQPHGNAIEDVEIADVNGRGRVDRQRG